MEADAGVYDGRTPTESAHIDVISERLRLLYVGITRARRFLQVSRSRNVMVRGVARETDGANAVGILAQFLHQYKA